METLKTLLNIANSLSGLLLPAIYWIVKTLNDTKSTLDQINAVMMVKLDNQQQQFHKLEVRLSQVEATVETLKLELVKDFATHADYKELSEELKRIGEAMNKLAISQETMRRETLQGITQCYKDCHANT